jgi:hypothetical protein
VSRPPDLLVSILLYIVGIMLVITAVLILLKGLGWLTVLPDYAIWAIVLLAMGIGIIAGVRSYNTPRQ